MTKGNIVRTGTHIQNHILLNTSHTTVSMFIVVLCVKVSAHEWSKLTRARSEIYAFQCGDAGVRKTVCQC